MVGLSVKALAKEIGCDWTTAANWEPAISQPGPDQAVRLMARLSQIGSPLGRVLARELEGR